MTEANTQPVAIGLDDGFAFTKVALPDGRLVAIPSRARLGHGDVTWLNGLAPQLTEYTTDDTVYSVGDVDGDPTHFDGYPFSGLNRVIVQHALQSAGLAGASVHAVSGLPVSRFYRQDGQRRQDLITRKTQSLKRPVQPHDGRPSAAIAFHAVMPEALAAWYDQVIIETETGAKLDDKRLRRPIAVVDIGGRTTDYVVVADQALRHAHSGSLLGGLFDVRHAVAQAIQQRFDLDALSPRTLDAALQQGRIKLFGRDEDVAAIVATARRQLVERIHGETQRLLGRGAELDQILFVGGGALALSDAIADWFPNQQIAPHPAFANARGMRKFLRYVGTDIADSA